MDYFAATIASLLILGCASTGKVSARRIFHRTIDLRIAQAQDASLSDGSGIE
jgi:hypothetical protein